MNSIRLRHLAVTGFALAAFGAAGCSAPSSDVSNGASAAEPGDVATTVGSGDESPSGESTSETVTGSTGESADGGTVDATDGADAVVAVQDGIASNPASSPASSDPVQEVAVQGPDTAEVCAIVEFGYLGLLSGDSEVDIDSRLSEGAQAALVLDDERYVQSGQALLEAVGSPDAGERADALLAFCADDGFERLG